MAHAPSIASFFISRLIYSHLCPSAYASSKQAVRPDLIPFIHAFFSMTYDQVKELKGRAEALRRYL
jgi:hypothetical protein